MPLLPFSLPAGLSADTLRKKLPHYVAQYPYAAFLDSNGFADPYGRYEWIAAWSARPNAVFTLEKLKQGKGKWRFGLCSFELKNRLLSKVSTTKPQTLAFPELAFFEPEMVIACERITGALVAEGKGIDKHLAAIASLALPDAAVEWGVPPEAPDGDLPLPPDRGVQVPDLPSDFEEDFDATQGSGARLVGSAGCAQGPGGSGLWWLLLLQPFTSRGRQRWRAALRSRRQAGSSK